MGWLVSSLTMLLATQKGPLLHLAHLACAVQVLTLFTTLAAKLLSHHSLAAALATPATLVVEADSAAEEVSLVVAVDSFRTHVVYCLSVD